MLFRSISGSPSVDTAKGFSIKHGILFSMHLEKISKCMLDGFEIITASGEAEIPLINVV